MQHAHAAGKASRDLSDDERRWKAVVERDRSADGQFWYAVSTTGVYCYPSCGSRRARRANVAFYDTREAAERAGYRPCRRCRAELEPRHMRHADAIAAACRTIEQSDVAPPLAQLAAAAGLSPHHFQRRFKELVGMTPKRFAMACRSKRVRDQLGRGTSVTDAIYDSGFSSSAGFYEGDGRSLGMPPRAFARGGKDELIRWDTADCWLGRVLVAATERGICAVVLGADDAAVAAELEARFPHARLEHAEPGSPFTDWIDGALATIDAPDEPADLPLDIAGTAFQHLVWDALRRIPAGETTTYRALAERIGRPSAARAVAGACAANPAAVLVPCHRVVASNGALSGYRWGKGRKRALLERERRD